MKFTWLLTFSLLSFQAGAAEIVTPQPIRTSGLGLAATVVTRLENTVHRLQMNPDSPTSYCTVFPVTPDGYLLTALHCVRECLVEQDKAEIAGNDYLGLKDLFVVRQPEKTETTCSKYRIEGLNVTEGAQVVATGSALMLYTSQLLIENSGYMEQLRTLGWNRRANDFALLKISPASPLKCLRLNPRAPRAGQELWAIGYPVNNKSDGAGELSASRGILFGRVEQSKMYKGQKTESERTWVRAQFDANNLIFSTAWNEFGQSGGPIVDTNGHVIGITSGFAAAPPGTDGVKPHELVGSNTANVLRSLPPELARELLGANKSCK